MGIFDKLFGNKGDNEEPPEFTAFLEGAMEGLAIQTAAHRGGWHFGEEESWDFAQDDGELVFTFPQMIVSAPAQIIGSFNSHDSTWLWAWANESLVEPVMRDSLRVKAYGEQHGIKRLIEPGWRGTEMDAWKMAALACRLCEANGAYRGPSGGTFVFFTFGEVELRRRSE